MYHQEAYKTLVEAVISHAKDYSDKQAVCFRDKQLTYKKLYEKMRCAASGLLHLQVKRGDRVLLTAVSKPEYIIALLAIQYVGAIAVPVDKGAKEDSLIAIVEAVEPVMLLSDTQMIQDILPVFSLKKLSEAGDLIGDYRMPRQDEILELLFTSGTTGEPKGVILTCKCIYSNMQNTWNGVGMLKDDVILLPLPLNHSFGMRVLRAALYIGATVVLQNGFAFTKEIEKNITAFNCTALVSVPTSMEVMLSQMQDRAFEVLGKLRYIEISAGALCKRLRKRLPEILPNTEIHNTWGSTESGGALFLNIRKNPEKIDSIGKPPEHISLKVLDRDNREIISSDVHHAGRMAIKGEMQMAGYWNMPEQTKETIREGWLVTNDLVYVDADGFVYMLGRADDIINVGGEKVSPIEIEAVASGYEGIKECACIGVKDVEGVWGQIPVLYYVPLQAYSKEKFLHFLTERLEKYKIPHKFMAVDELPRTQMRKLDRKALRHRWEEIGERDLINPVISNILSRRSIREFIDKEIPHPVLEMICKAGMFAPSGHNLQTWRLTVIENKEKINQLKAVSQIVTQKKKVNFYGFNFPQYLILVSNDRRNPDGIQDASCAAQNIMLAAHSYGIGSVWLNQLMTICDETEIRKLLDSYGIPKEHIVWACIALGYHTETGHMLAKKKDVITYIK